MKILDVGGYKQPYKKATHIIDIMPKPDKCTREYTQQDICSGRWPYKDKEFDSVYCSNVLEDIKDPIFVCNEIIRVGKAGIIIVPSCDFECRRGVDSWPGNEMYTGFVHHRWLCFNDAGKLTFMQKTPITHVFDWTEGMSDEDIRKKAFLRISWKDDFKFVEVPLAEWDNWYNILKHYFGIDPLTKEDGTIKVI